MTVRRLYPISLDLRGQRTLVVGGGAVAGRKVAALLSAGARVTVVAPRLSAAVARAARRGRVTLRRRRARAADLRGAALAFFASDDHRANRRLAQVALRRGIWVNVADRPELCTFQLPSQLGGGALLLTISTGGAAPAFARSLRRHLQRSLWPSWRRGLRLVAAARAFLRQRVATSGGRQRLLRRLAGEPLWPALVAGEGNVLKRHICRALGENLGRLFWSQWVD
jgi:precorrin-2 dehydrogenase / sirohydrochlorin ferrochelatase